MPAAPAAPPVTPAAPAAPSAPVAAPPAPAAPLEGGEADAYATAFGELDQLDAKDKAPVARDPKGKFTPAPKKADEPAKPSDQTPVVDPNKAKDGQPAKPVADVDTGKPVKAADLRAAYDLKKARVAELEPQVASLTAKVAELEKRAPADLTQNADYQAAIKERDELREEIRFVNYSKHPEFQTKYAQPYVESWNEAVEELTQFTIAQKTGTDPATGEDITAERAVTPDDIVAFAAMPPKEMDRALEQAFGPSAKRFVQHIEKLRTLAKARDKALANARTESATHEKTVSEQNKAQTQKLLSSYQKTDTDLKAKYPQRFGPIEGDAEGNALLEKSSKWVEDTFSSESKLPQEERANRFAAIRLHAKAYPRALKQLSAANARIKELEASLAEFEKSGAPGDAGDPASRNGGGKNYLEDANAELDSLNKPSL